MKDFEMKNEGVVAKHVAKMILFTYGYIILSLGCGGVYLIYTYNSRVMTLIGIYLLIMFVFNLMMIVNLIKVNMK